MVISPNPILVTTNKIAAGDCPYYILAPACSRVLPSWFIQQKEKVAKRAEKYTTEAS
jgi:hypothetical protein